MNTTEVTARERALSDMVTYQMPGDASVYVQHASLALPEGAELLDTVRAWTPEDDAELRTISGPSARLWVIARLEDAGLPTSGTIRTLLRDLFVASVIANDRQMLRCTVEAFDALAVELPEELRAIAVEAGCC